MVFKKVEFFNNISISEMSSQMLRIGQRKVIGNFSDYSATATKSKIFAPFF